MCPSSDNESMSGDVDEEFAADQTFGAESSDSERSEESQKASNEISVEALRTEKGQTTVVHKTIVKNGKDAKKPSKERNSESMALLPFACDICDRRFFLQSGLKRHQKKHRRIAPQFICDECGKTLKHNYILSIHQRSHNGLKPYA
ncbi:Zinc finger and BTB domain-containing protein 7A [Pseudolycoriella hygida]|uniref:Zinc finger and BTB domain-containing protein 7A n=1 Tax=Pseudolycoriella hygida TaxID=35572 RepID=A0A9Q0S4S9_9DIPT|nr:Zinc finger and BTB domain-containing protein 7A [Pseudolycoriella hygida]